MRCKYSLTEEEIAYLSEHYHNTPDQELADAVGISIHTLHARRRRHGWRKDEEYMKRVRHESAMKYKVWERLNVKETHAKGIATRKKIYEVEQIRIRWGLPQLTKRHFRTELREKQVQRNYLIRLGYIVDDTRLVAYYTPDTHRARRLERLKRGEKKGNIKPYYEFRPYEHK